MDRIILSYNEITVIIALVVNRYKTTELGMVDENDVNVTKFNEGTD